MTEQDKFEAAFPMPPACERCGDGYVATQYGAWDAHKYAEKYRGWKARAALESAPPSAEFDREKAARLADELAAELAKLQPMPMHWQRAGDVMTTAKFCMEPLARNLRNGVYACFEPGQEIPAWLKD